MVTFPAYQAFKAVAQAFAALTGPADLPAGISNDDGVVGNVFVDEGARTDETIATKRRTAYNG